MRAPSIIVPILFAGFAAYLILSGQAAPFVAWLQGALTFVLAVWGAWQSYTEGQKPVHDVHTMDREALREDGFFTRWLRG